MSSFKTYIESYALLALLVCVVFFYFSDSSKKNSYKVFGSGEYTILLDAKTGESWILESTPLANPKTNSLARNMNYVSPGGTFYHWTPVAIIPCYKEAIGLCKHPEEARGAEKQALVDFEKKNSTNEGFIDYFIKQ